MKVLMVHKTYKGGVSVHVKSIFKELLKRGFEVHEITRNEDLRFNSFICSYWKLKKLFGVWSLEYDIIHAHDWSIVFPGVQSNLKNLVGTFHALPTNPLAKYFEDKSIKKLGRRAIVVSPKMKRIYHNATLIPNGVDLNLFKPLKNVKRERLLVGIAQEYNKTKILKILEKVGLKYICTEGKLKFEKLPEFYSKIEIFISIPYKQAGFNMVWLEAMACEVPYIIGTNVGIGEKLPIYKVKNFHELEELLVEIKNGNMESLKNQRKWIITNKLTWKNHVKKLIKVYEEVL